ncbi:MULTISPECIES: asparagine synthase-related protein [Microbacterium]|uniref:asparagine synthase-related protein n=1 Tax=Microbacterium TaxID=33882 RepID=UPI00146BCA7F|nr:MULTISPECIES: asparagine synthase-related protein [Microbacterium]
MIGRGALPGFLAAQGTVQRPDPDSGTGRRVGPVDLTHWGLDGRADAELLVLSPISRVAHGAVSRRRIREGMAGDPAMIGAMLPPFAAAEASVRGVTMAADSMGFRPLFHSAPGGGPAVMSTSALVAGRAIGAGPDDVAVAVQSLLGWQLGQRTLSAGISKLSPGHVATLGADGVRVTGAEFEEPAEIGLADAVSEAVELLRTSLEALLDDHPDAVLQLTGGQDSRLLLSAVHPARRRGLRALTLAVPGSGDVAMASQLAARFGLEHQVRELDGLDGVDPADAWDEVCEAARALDGMADPIAFAALALTERGTDAPVRISGLGGEVARGFYYVGVVRDRTYTRRDSERLAAWRMFANESVEHGMLDEEFAAWARETAVDEVDRALRGGGAEWYRATDALYLRHRMQRWAGATDTAADYERILINPMLDARFLDIATRLAPHDKAGSRFLGQLQMALDPELGRLPLEGRLAPQAYAHPTARTAVSDAAGRAGRLARKALQRLNRGNRAPAGGDTLAGLVVAYWRAHPEVVAPLARGPFVRADWIADVLARRIEPRPSSVAFATNLLVAAGSDAPDGALARPEEERKMRR